MTADLSWLVLLRTQLQEQQSQLQTDLVELINRDYEDFLNLSRNLRGLDQHLLSMRSDLQTMDSAFKRMDQMLSDSIDSVVAGLNEKQEMDEKMSGLNLCMQVHETLEKLEKWLDVLPVVHQGSQLDLDDQYMKQLERLASGLNQIKFLMIQGAQFKFIENQKERQQRISETVQLQLRKILKRAIDAYSDSEKCSQSDWARIAFCLRVYALIDHHQTAETVIREHLINSPAWSQLKEQCVSLKRESSVWFEKAYSWVLSHKRLITTARDAIQHSPFRLFTHCLWNPLVGVLLEQSGLYTPGIPTTFHQNYKESMNFVAKLKLLAGEFHEAEDFVRDPLLQQFEQKWPTSVYFQIVAKDLVAKIEENFKTAEVSTWKQEFKTNDWCISLTNLMDCSIQYLWSQEIWLPPLNPQLWKLTLQILISFNNWSLQTIDSFPSSADANQNLDNLVCLYKDVLYFTNDRWTVHTSVIEPLFAGCFSKEDFAEIMKDAISPFDRTINATEDRIVQAISSPCLEVLGLMKNIPVQYRRTNKETPTKPSYFIVQSLKPLEMFMDKHRQWLSPVYRQKMTRKVVEQIASDYKNRVSEMLVSIKNVEDSLKRLQQKKTKSKEDPSADPSLSDEDKIRLQISLDIHEFCSMVTKLDGETADTVQDLQNMAQELQAAIS